jgi:hypothetical protein
VVSKRYEQGDPITINPPGEHPSERAVTPVTSTPGESEREVKGRPTPDMPPAATQPFKGPDLQSLDGGLPSWPGEPRYRVAELEREGVPRDEAIRSGWAEYGGGRRADTG